MKKCPFCAELIKRDAVLCKHCQRDVPKEKEEQRLNTLSGEEKERHLKRKEMQNKIEKTAFKIVKVLMLMGGTVMVMMLVWLGFVYEPSRSYVSSSSDSSSSEVDTLEAYNCAKEKVEDVLKSPSSADFPSMFSIDYDNFGDSWTVNGYVDAQNSFGASLRSDFRCSLTIPNRGSCSGYCSVY